MNGKPFRLLTSLAVLFGLFLASGWQAYAQDTERTWVQVRTVHVKPGMVNEFIELQKSLVSALKSEGRNGRSTWREVRGDLATFHFVQPVADLAELDTPFEPPMDDDDWTDWVAALLNTTDSSSRTILRRHQEWSIPAKPGSTPTMAVLISTTVMPAKMGDYHNWVRDQLIPALKKGGATGVNFNHGAFGGNTNTWIVGAQIDSWAQLQTPRGVLGYMSDADYAKLMAPRAQMVTSTDRRVLQYQPELSF